MKWSWAAHNNQFVTSVDAISIVIMEIDATSSNYRLEILDESGETVESFRYQDTRPDEDELLARLFVLARRSALNTDLTLEKLAKALEL